MDNSVAVQMLDGGEHLAHDVSGLALSEFLGSDNTVEELTTWAVLHDDVDVAVIDIALIKLHDIGVVNRGKDSQFLLQKSDIFSDVLTED